MSNSPPHERIRAECLWYLSTSAASDNNGNGPFHQHDGSQKGRPNVGRAEHPRPMGTRLRARREVSPSQDDPARPDGHGNAGRKADTFHNAYQGSLTGSVIHDGGLHRRNSDPPDPDMP
ncbi:hypothetical protein EYF80_024605 [Liparis tanakae]|uniref:Uncharacterized protein n=1 Tax=Liparis tanakae TaxID=230148 RepID=A0A4Z2HH58_9TELE|nr:hypothetical protein EYF80_024605 [Liparis tanakae]